MQKRCMTESSCSCWCRQSSSTNAFMKRLLSWCRSLPVTAEMLYRCAASWMSVWHTDVVKVCSSLWCPWWSTVLSRSNAMSDRRVSKRCARSRSSSSRASSKGGWRSAVCASPAGMAGSEPGPSPAGWRAPSWPHNFSRANEERFTTSRFCTNEYIEHNECNTLYLHVNPVKPYRRLHTSLQHQLRSSAGSARPRDHYVRQVPASTAGGGSGSIACRSR